MRGSARAIAKERAMIDRFGRPFAKERTRTEHSYRPFGQERARLEHSNQPFEKERAPPHSSGALREEFASIAKRPTSRLEVHSHEHVSFRTWGLSRVEERSDCAESTP